MTESWWVALNQFGTRVYVIPPALGIDQRIVNGYLYISPNSITDPELIATRAELFTRRAGHYYENWDEIYDNWIAKAEDCIHRLRELEIRDLPEVEPEAVVFSHRGLTTSYDLLATYNRLIENMQEMAYYHFEMLGLGYAAYLTFRDFCQNSLPGHRRPGDLQDGRRHRHPVLPARRRGAQAGGARDRARTWRT